MNFHKKEKLKPLIESHTGIHATIYLENKNDLRDLHNQLFQALQNIDFDIHSVLSEQDKEDFLSPMRGLLFHNDLLEKLQGHVGLFRTQDSFRILSIPIEVKHSSHVATTFHVKPLLKWLQIDKEFYFLGLEKNLVHIYTGSEYAFSKTETVDLKNGSFQRNNSVDNLKDNSILFWYKNWIYEKSIDMKTNIFIAGEKSLTDLLTKNKILPLSKDNVISTGFDLNSSKAYCALVRLRMQKIVKTELHTSLVEFYNAEEQMLTCRNVFEIAKKAVAGDIKKLIINSDITIHGRFNKKNGDLFLNQADLDHEDDDILDDLAQEVLARGGEVVLASDHEIPKGRSILAILEHESFDLDGYKNEVKNA